MISGWRYYNHAAMPSTPPYEEPDLTPIKNGSIWKIRGGNPLLAWWISEFDCGYETDWWYVIKDSKFDISKLKSKRRYVIKKGIEKFDVKSVNPKECKEEIYQIQNAAFKSYPQKYRPTVNKDKLYKEIASWNHYKFYGAFFKGTEEMVGYALLNYNGREINYSQHKVMPDYEKYQVNAAIVNHVLLDNEELLDGNGYINDGSRNIIHETAFQDYLEKYFGFRKAYCKLHIKYRFPIIVGILYPFREKINKDGKLGCRVYAVLKMEEFKRNSK